MKEIRDRLKLDKKFNPFHDEFDASAIKKVVEETASTNSVTPELERLMETVAATIIVNAHYKDVYHYLKSRIEEINLSYEQIIGAELAIRNRHYIISNGIDKYSNEKVVKFEDVFKRKIESADSSIGRINQSGALETEIDGLNVFFNYLKYFRDFPKQIQRGASQLEVIENLTWVGLISTFYYVLKSSYEDAIWQNGYITYDASSKTILIRLSDAKSQILYRVGYFRLENNAMGFFMAGKSLIDHNHFRGITENDVYKISKRRIESVKVVNGYLKYKLTKRSSTSYAEQLVELANESSLLAFYSYLENVNLPKLNGFTIRKLIA